jgi:hypothetical protein
MSWFKIDDKMTFHHKVLKAGNAAIGAWARIGALVSLHQRDGFIDRKSALTIATLKELSRLQEAGLLDVVEGGYRMHDFLDYNPTAAEVQAKRDARAEAGKRGGLRSAEVRAQANAKQLLERSSSKPQANEEAKLNPVPTRPDPDPKREEEPPTPKGSGGGVPREVFDHYLGGWAKHVGGGSLSGAPKFTAERARLIQARLRDGFDAATLKRACDGLWLSPFHMGANNEGKRWTDPKYVFRSASQVETCLAAYAETEVQPPDPIGLAPAPPEPNEPPFRPTPEQVAEVQQSLDALGITPRNPFLSQTGTDE